MLVCGILVEETSSSAPSVGSSMAMSGSLEKETFESISEVDSSEMTGGATVEAACGSHLREGTSIEEVSCSVTVIGALAEDVG